MEKDNEIDLCFHNAIRYVGKLKKELILNNSYDQVLQNQLDYIKKLRKSYVKNKNNIIVVKKKIFVKLN